MPLNLSGTLTMTSLFQLVNDNTGFMFGNAILIMVFSIFFLASKSNFEASRAFSGASFLTVILAVFLRVLGLVGDWGLGITVMLLLLGFIWLRLDSD